MQSTMQMQLGRSRAIALLTLATLVLVLAGASAAQPRPIETETLLAADAGTPGSDLRGALRVQLEPGLHMNSQAPLDDFLIPTALRIAPPDGITVTEIAYPEAGLLEQFGADTPLAVFEERFSVGVVFALAGDLPAGQYTVPGSLRYQACDETMCYMPTTAEFEWTVDVVPAGTGVASRHAELFGGISFGSENSVAPPQTRTSDTLAVAASGTSALSADAAEDGTGVTVALGAFDILGTTGGYLDSEDFLSFVSAAESGEAQRGWFEGRGPLAILLLILLGGLALNLTPCVLPMIPINIAIIGAGARAGSRVRGLLLGGAYGAAMAAVYGALGLIVILTAGTFGTINASPWFNLGIAALFVVLALAMFDVLVIDFSRFQSKLKIGNNENGSFMAAFGMGTVAALLAGACVAPVVIQVILFSSDLYATGATVALLLPFCLGIGMALPWPIAGAGLSFLPKPGAWMVHVKHAFGVFILGTAVYYGYVAYGIFENRWVDAGAVASSVEEKLEEGWYASLSEGLEAARAENKLVLVDLWATWCKNCLTMDQTTFKDPTVTAELDAYVKIKFQAEDPSSPPAKDVMDHFDSVGLPTYVILRPADLAAASTTQ
jgi:thiol:disulfide interchange protein|tara:strand:+ start:254 stop:2074 length:1821 start_codon:yes stop_codon:yes gene_type:complete